MTKEVKSDGQCLVGSESRKAREEGFSILEENNLQWNSKGIKKTFSEVSLP